MPRIRSVSDFRAALGDEAKEYSDERLLAAMAAGSGIPIEAAAEKYGFDNNSGPWKEKLSASVDRYQGSLYGVAEAGARKFGFTSVADAAQRRREANEISGEISSRRAKAGGIPDDWRDIDGIASGARWVGGLAVDSLPYIAEAATGGIAGRAVIGGARAAMGGAAVASYPSAVGDILGNQREQAGETDLRAAAALGVPYAALNGVLGLESLAARATLPRVVSPVLDNIGGVRGRLARAGATGVQTAFTEGTSETGQEMLNQLGRMSVDERETFFNEESKKRFTDSFVGGAALGGAIGGGLSGGRRSQYWRGDSSPMDTPAGADTNAPMAQDILALPYDPRVSGAVNGVVNPNPYFAFPDGSTALNSEVADERRFAPQAGTPDPSVPLAFDENASVDFMAPAPRPSETGGVQFEADRTGGLSLAEPRAQTAAPGLDFDTAFDTGTLALQQEGSTEEAPPVPAEQPAPEPGNPEAIARIEETRARKVAANEAIGRAKEAGMESEKQQSLFWRAEELLKQNKIDDSSMTQVIALLMQSKFGVAKTKLDEAAAGQPDADGQAVAKNVTRTLEQIDKEITKAAADKTFDKAGKRPKIGSPERVKFNAAVEKIKALQAERENVVAAGAKQAGVRQAPAVDPAPAQAALAAPESAPAPTAGAAAVEPTIEPATPAKRLKTAAEKVNKIKRLEAFLTCLRR